jgi:chorismate synthase
MSGNIFGRLLTLTSFGESHGLAVGGVLDGFPSGIKIDFESISREMARRRPGQSALVSQRNEADQVEILSGIFEGISTGAPIGFIIRNNDVLSTDYNHLKEVYRPGHADKTYDLKYGYRDHRGGGRSSARETAVRVAAGAIARHILPQIQIQAFVSGVGSITLRVPYHDLDLNKIDSNPVRCPHTETAIEMEAVIAAEKAAGDSIGGIITCVVKGIPAGLGEPVFDKLHARLGQAMLSINAVKGFEIGGGFSSATMRGSLHNKLSSGGVLGGISTGEDLVFRVAFKPVSTIMQDQITVDKNGNEVVLEGKGRHDPCVVPRAVPIVEAMTALVLADFYLINKLYQNKS